MIAQHCEALCSSITNCWRHHELSAAARAFVSVGPDGSQWLLAQCPCLVELHCSCLLRPSCLSALP